MAEAYHSAYSPPMGAQPMQTCANGTVFVHDIMSAQELPAQYDDAGALYVEIPWQKGFSVFNKRAGVKDGRTYAQFLSRVDLLALDADRPVYVITSAAAGKQLSGKAYPILLDRPDFKPVASAVVAYNTLAPLERTTSKLISRLVREWITVGDFCCGYGTTIRAAIRNGTAFVASDYNAEAIGYVCANLGKWK